jgi:DNA-binding NarL/FixJ family response regulator
MTARVVIADDHPPTRLGIKFSLEGHGFEVVAEVGTADGAVEAVLELRPEVALLDVRMPGNGITAARRITREAPEVAVVMLTVSRDDGDLFEALRAGARGYLLKDIDPARLPLALNGVLDGEAALPRGLVARLVEEFRSREQDPRRGDLVGFSLTEREWQVLEQLGQGHSTSHIARTLFVSPVTVRTHVSAVLRKLGVDSREAAVRALNNRERSGPG